MSAEAISAPLEPTPKPERESRKPHLREVQNSPRSPRVPFILVLGVLIVAGMAGLVVLNTVIQSQAAEVAKLRNESAALGYQQAALTAEVQQLRSAGSLQQKAYALGMRPNPAPAFILLPSGKIVGKPTVVTGKELPDQQYLTWQQQQQAQQNARAEVARQKAAEAKRRAEEAKRKAEEAKRKQAEEAKRKAEEAKKKAQQQKPTPQPAVKPTTKPTTKPTGGR